MDDVNDADERRCAIGDRRGSTHDLDSLDVTQIQCGQRRIECAAPRDVVDHEQERVELAQAPELRYRTSRSRIATGCHFHACGERERVSNVGCPDGAERVAIDDFY